MQVLEVSASLSDNFWQILFNTLAVIRARFPLREGEEFGIIFTNPMVNLNTVITFVLAFAMAMWERKYLMQYDGTPQSIEITNKKLKISALGNIAIPITLQVIQATTIVLFLKKNNIQLRAFLGHDPTLFIYMVSNVW